MKPVSNWEEADLWALIKSRAQESATLDFKQSAKLNRRDPGRTGLSKMVSSMANAAGGILVFGIREDGHFAVDLDEGIDPSDVSKETVDQIISTTIQPKVEGYVIKQIWLEGDRAGRVAYVIEVPQATTRAPHQASDGKYYKRSNFESVPMMDYEIRDAFRRGTSPALEVTFSLSAEHPTAQGIAFDLLPVAVNHAEEPALYWLVNLLIDSALTFANPQGYTQAGMDTMRFGDHVYRLYSFNRKFMVPNAMPLFKRVKLDLGRISVGADIGRGYGIGYTIACPGFFSDRRAVLSTLGGKPKIDWVEQP